MLPALFPLLFGVGTKAEALRFMFVTLSSEIREESWFRDCSASGSLIDRLLQKLFWR